MVERLLTTAWEVYICIKAFPLSEELAKGSRKLLASPAKVVCSSDLIVAQKNFQVKLMSRPHEQRYMTDLVEELQ